MAIKFPTIQTQDQDLNRVQNNISQVLNSVSTTLTNGVLIQNVKVNSTATVINHGLGRTPQLWILCDQNTNTTISRTAWSSQTITLKAGSSCTISLWVA